MIKEIYLLFQKRITDTLPEVQYVSFYNNEFGDMSKQRELPLPAILVEVKPITNIHNYSNHIQHAVVNVDIHIGTEIYEGIEFQSSNQNDALNHLEFAEKVYKNLDNIGTFDVFPITGTTVSGITYDYENFQIANVRRKAVRKDYSKSALHVTIITFEMDITDKTAMPVYQTLLVDMEVSAVTYKTSL